MKTAGQPERRVRVVKTEKLPDGTQLTDVKDLASGVVYTLTNPAVLDKPATGAVPEAVTKAPPPATTTGTVAPAAGTPRPIFGGLPNQPTTAKTPATQKPSVAAGNTPRPIFGSFPSQSQPPALTPGLRTTAGERLVPADAVPPADAPPGLPHARARKTDPLLAGASTSPAAIAGRTPFVAIPPGSPPSVLGKILGEPADDHVLPQPRVGVLPKPTGADADLGAPPTMLPPSAVATKPAVIPVGVAKADPPAPPKAPTEGLAIPSLDPNAKPTAATGIFDSQPPATVQAGGVEQPSVAIPPIDAAPAAAAPSRVIPPIEEQTPPPAPLPVPTPALVPPPVATLPPVTEPPVAVQPPVAVPVAAIPTPATEAAPKLVPPVVDVPAVEVPKAVAEAPKAVMNGPLPADVQAMLESLKTHRRPSFRMENATSLGESAYSKHPDVLAGLMQAARSDATGVVRGHCISQLAAVGYSDATFVQLLDTWTNDSEPAVRRAAAAAKTKLTGR